MKTFSTGPIHVGLDVHKLTVTAAVLEPASVSPVVTRISSDDESVRKLLERCGQPEQLRVCYEAGPTGFALARTLSS